MHHAMNGATVEGKESKATKKNILLYIKLSAWPQTDFPPSRASQLWHLLQSQGFIPRAMPHIFHLTNSNNTIFFLLASHTHLYFSKQSLTISVHLFRGRLTKRFLTHSLGSLIITHSYHMAQPLENTLINPFELHTLPYLCILCFINPPNSYQTSEVVHL